MSSLGFFTATESLIKTLGLEESKMARQPSQTGGLWVQVKVPVSMSKNYTWVQFLAFKCMHIHVVPLGDLGTWAHTHVGTWAHTHTHTGYINSTLTQNSVVVSTITMFINFETEWGGSEEIKFFFFCFRTMSLGRSLCCVHLVGQANLRILLFFRTAVCYAWKCLCDSSLWPHLLFMNAEYRLVDHDHI